MQQRVLGSGTAALEVPAQGLGCMGMSATYGPSDEVEAVATIQAALDAGVVHLDTADAYGPHPTKSWSAVRSGPSRRGRARDEVRPAGPRGRNAPRERLPRLRPLGLRRQPGAPGRRSHPRFQGENLTQNLEMVERVRELAARKGVTSAQLALAWVLAQGDDVVAIPGTKRRAHLQENVDALAVELTTEDLRALDEIAPSGAAAGARYPEPMMGMLRR